MIGVHIVKVTRLKVKDKIHLSIAIISGIAILICVMFQVC